MDEIHAAVEPVSDMAEYMIRRLPGGAATEGEDPDGPARGFLGKSLGAFVARGRKEEAWVESRVEAALESRRRDPTGAQDMTWAEQLAASAGVPVDVISALGEWLEEGLAKGWMRRNERAGAAPLSPTASATPRRVGGIASTWSAAINSVSTIVVVSPASGAER